MCNVKYVPQQPFRSTLNRGYITGLDMCKLCTTVYIPQHFKQGLHDRLCVKYVPQYTLNTDIIIWSMQMVVTLKPLLLIVILGTPLKPPLRQLPPAYHACYEQLAAAWQSQHSTWSLTLLTLFECRLWIWDCPLPCCALWTPAGRSRPPNKSQTRTHAWLWNHQEQPKNTWRTPSRPGDSSGVTEGPQMD